MRGPNLGQPVHHLSAAPTEGFGEEAAQTTSIRQQLQPDACRKKKVSWTGVKVCVWGGSAADYCEILDLLFGTETGNKHGADVLPAS